MRHNPKHYSFQKYRHRVASDLYRYCGAKRLSLAFKHYFTNPGFRYSFLLRTAAFGRVHLFPFFPIFLLVRLLLLRYTFKYGISIPYETEIGPGLYIGHFGGIVVSGSAKIGANCNINHGVTIGETFGGKHPGIPIIGDNVYLGPGAKIIGGITIGNHVAVGANAVVTKSVPDHVTVAGIPAKPVSETGSGHYITNTDY